MTQSQSQHSTISAPAGSKAAHIALGLDRRDLQYLEAVPLDYVRPRSQTVRGRSID